MYANSGTDLDGTAISAIEAADTDAHVLAMAGTPTATAGELAVVGGLIAACRGRGVSHPLLILLNLYRNSSTAQHSTVPEMAVACGATEKAQGAV